MRDAKKNVQPDESALSAAKDAAKKLHRLLLKNSSKGRIARKDSQTTDFRGIGKSELHDEIYLAVKALTDANTPPGKACKSVAEAFHETPQNIEKIYRRKRSQYRRDIELAATAAGCRPCEFSDKSVTD